MTDIEVLDDADAYPYSTHISIDGYELEIGDLLLVFEDAESTSVYSFERVYGFTWGNIITHVVEGAVAAEVHDIHSIFEDLEVGKICIAPRWHQDSYRADEDTVRRISLYRHYYGNGVQPILIDETRPLLSTDFTTEELALCKNASEVIEEVYQSSRNVDQEAEELRKFFESAGFKDRALPSNHSLSTFEE